MGSTGKGKYWVAVLYPESMINNWRFHIDDVLQVPFSYCLHNQDFDSEDEERKEHIHLIIAFKNTTTYNHALSVFQKLQPSCKFCEQVLNIRYMYNYLIHDTDSCKKKNKHLYDITERVCGNGFDIGCFEQISITDKRAMLKELCDFIVDHKIDNFTDFYCNFVNCYGSEYFEVVSSYSGLLERLCKGNYLNNCRRI